MLDEIDDYFDSQISDSAECSSMVADAPPFRELSKEGPVFCAWLSGMHPAAVASANHLC